MTHSVAKLVDASRRIWRNSTRQEPIFPPRKERRGFRPAKHPAYLTRLHLQPYGRALIISAGNQGPRKHPKTHFKKMKVS